MKKENKRILGYLLIGSIAFVAIYTHKGITSIEIQKKAKEVKIVIKEATSKIIQADTSATRDGTITPDIIIKDDICSFAKITNMDYSNKKMHDLFFDKTNDIKFTNNYQKSLWNFFKNLAYTESTGKLPYLSEYEEELSAIKAHALSGGYHFKIEGIKTDYKQAETAILNLIDKYPHNALYPMMLYQLKKKTKIAYSARRDLLIKAMTSSDFYTPEYKIIRSVEREFISSSTRLLSLYHVIIPTIYYHIAQPIVNKIETEDKEYAKKALTFARMLQLKMEKQDGYHENEAINIYGLSNRIINAINKKWKMEHTSKYSYLDSTSEDIPADLNDRLNEIEKEIEQAKEIGNEELLKEYKQKRLEIYSKIAKLTKYPEPEDNWINPYSLLIQDGFCDRTGMDQEFDLYMEERDHLFNFSRYIRHYSLK